MHTCISLFFSCCTIAQINIFTLHQNKAFFMWRTLWKSAVMESLTARIFKLTFRTVYTIYIPCAGVIFCPRWAWAINKTDVISVFGFKNWKIYIFILNKYSTNWQLSNDIKVLILRKYNILRATVSLTNKIYNPV